MYTDLALGFYLGKARLHQPRGSSAQQGLFQLSKALRNVPCVKYVKAFWILACFSRLPCQSSLQASKAHRKLLFKKKDMARCALACLLWMCCTASRQPDQAAASWLLISFLTATYRQQ